MIGIYLMQMNCFCNVILHIFLIHSDIWNLFVAMEDCCVVCAEPLEWVGYGVCGHRDVCSTCISRLRFVLNDKKCCICKQECSIVFVTKVSPVNSSLAHVCNTSLQAVLWHERDFSKYVSGLIIAGPR